MSDHKYPTYFTYPDGLEPRAVAIAKRRIDGTAELRRVCPSYCREDEKKIGDLGGMAELIAVSFLQCWGIKHEVKFLADDESAGADLIVPPRRFDVKGCDSKARLLMVNDRAHRRSKGDVTHYWFIQLLGDCKCRFWIVPYDVVAGWPLVQHKKSAARQCLMNNFC